MTLICKPNRLVRLCALLGLIALGFGAVLGQYRAVTPARAAGVVGFGPTTVVDDQRLAGEPDVKVCGADATWSYGNCGQDNPYASVPWGFSTASSFVWRSEDQAQTFKLTPGNNTTGKPTACPGGGDSELAVSPGATQASDYVNFADLQGLTNISTATSADGGTTWTACNPITSDLTPVDRQWFGVYGNPAGAGATGNGSVVYLDYDVVAGSITGGTGCTSVVGGNEFVVETSTTGGLTWNPAVPVDCNDGIAGNIQVDQSNGNVYAIHTAYANPATGVTTDQVAVNVSTDHGATWRRSVVFQAPSGAACPTDCTVGQDFAVLAIDKSGGLYAVWSQAPVDSTGAIAGPSHIFYSYSGDFAKTWTPEQQVDTGVSTDVDLFPWIAAGNAGAIDVVWYGTTRSSTAASYDPGAQTSDWYPYMSQSLNANTTSATFSTPVIVAQHSNHNGGICTMGIGCTTGGDRSLADFFQVAVNKSGGADVVWADTSNNSNSGANQGALIDEARQISGPTLFGTTLSGSLTTCTAVTITPCQTDITGDAKYESNGIVGANVPKLDITGSSVNLDPRDPSRLDVRMNLADLSSLPSATDTDINANDVYVDYLTSWNYHIPGDTQTNFDSTGNVYYAYLEVNRAGTSGTINGAYDGNTCSIASTHGKYLVYPGQHSITYSINNTNGTIDLYVPLADVGNPAAGATLYSVTAHTVGQPAAAGPYTCTTRDPNGGNQDPTGQIFDVYDKSPAYTSLLTTPSPTFALLRRVSAWPAAHRMVDFHWGVSGTSRPLGFNLLVRRGAVLRRLNHGVIPGHASPTYVYRAHVAPVHLFYIQVLTAHGRMMYGPFRMQSHR